MISMFPRQTVYLRQGAYGQATVLLLTVLTAILSVAFMTVYLSTSEPKKSHPPMRSMSLFFRLQPGKHVGLT